MALDGFGLTCIRASMERTEQLKMLDNVLNHFENCPSANERLGRVNEYKTSFQQRLDRDFLTQ